MEANCQCSWWVSAVIPWQQVFSFWYQPLNWLVGFCWHSLCLHMPPLVHSHLKEALHEPVQDAADGLCQFGQDKNFLES